MLKLNMKKIVVLLMLLLSSIVIVGCKSDKDLGNEYIEKYDAQYMFMGNRDSNYITKSESGYYFLNGMYTYYCDFNTMEPIVLCNRPDCLHDKELDETKKYKCNGFVIVSPNEQFLGVYDGDLYCYIADDFIKSVETEKRTPELIKISLDGSKRSTVFKLDENITSMTLHRGKLYYVNQTIIDANKGIYKATLNERDLLSKNSVVKEIVSIEGISANINNIIPKGNKIIYNMVYIDENSQSVYSTEIYNFKNKDTTRVGGDVTKDDLGLIGISDNSIIFLPRKIVNDTVVLDQNVYSFDLDSNKSNILFERGFDDIIFYSDDKYIYSDNILQKYKSDGESFERKLAIYNKVGEAVETIDVSELKKDFYYFLSGDDKYMFIKGENEEGAYIKYIDKSQIGTGNAKLETLFELERKYLDTTISKIKE